MSGKATIRWTACLLTIQERFEFRFGSVDARDREPYVVTEHGQNIQLVKTQSHRIWGFSFTWRVQFVVLLLLLLLFYFCVVWPGVLFCLFAFNSCNSNEIATFVWYATHSNRFSMPIFGYLTPMKEKKHTFLWHTPFQCLDYVLWRLNGTEWTKKMPCTHVIYTLRKANQYRNIIGV